MKNKILPILCVFILISFLFINNSVFARDYTITEDALNSILNFAYNNEYYLDGYTNIYIGTAYKDSYAFDVVLVPNNATYKYQLGTGDRLLCTVDGIKIDFTSIRYGFNSDGSLNSTFVSDGPTIGTNVYGCRVLYTTPLYSTFDIYVEGSETEIFFQKAPVMEQEIPVTLAEIMKTAGEQATLEMGQIILIVIMTTVGLTVLLIGLKKGLTVLMSGFRH